MEELSKLEYFAAIAMQGMLANPANKGIDANTLAKESVYYAKTVINEAGKKDNTTRALRNRRKAEELLDRVRGQNF